MDFAAASRKDQHIEMFMAMEKALIQAKCMVQPVVYILPEVDKGIVGNAFSSPTHSLCWHSNLTHNFSGKLKEIVKKHQGLVTDNESEATHIVHSAADPLEEEYARPVFRRDRHTLLHWYYFPDSYDKWDVIDLPIDPPELADYQDVLAEQLSGGKARHVAANWILDLEQYNEWMNEDDYEVDSSGKKKVHKLRLSVEDLMMGSESGKRGGKTPAAGGAANKRRRSPSPAGSGGAAKGASAAGSSTPSGGLGAGNKRKSVRPSALGKKFKGGDDDGDDLTRDMEDPPSDTNLREVEVPKSVALPGGLASGANVKKDSDWMPTKGSLPLRLSLSLVSLFMTLHSFYRCCSD